MTDADRELQAEVARVLDEIENGSSVAADDLMPIVYDQLRALAGEYLRRENPGHTLQATAIVNEAFLRLADQKRVQWKGRTHFFAVGANIMRRILVDHARTKKRAKRGGGMHRVELTTNCWSDGSPNLDVLAVEDALEKLAKLDERQARIVELRFFGGLTVEEVATVLDVSKRTVEAEWTMIRAWLRRELNVEG